MEQGDWLAEASWEGTALISPSRSTSIVFSVRKAGLNLLLIGGVGLGGLVIIVVVVIFLRRRSKPSEEEEEEYYF